MGASLEVTRDKQIVTARLARPEKMNALNKDIFDGLESLVDVLETDKSARVLVLTGSGEKSFCVGADLKERQGMNEKDVLARFQYVHQIYMRLERLHLPVIAAINGLALGGGFELALACDLRIASENVVIGFPEVELAIIPGNGGTQRLFRLVGEARALELILLAKRLNAAQALEFGLLNHVVSEGKAYEVALEWAEKMLTSGPLAIRAAKKAIRLGSQHELAEGLEIEMQTYKECLYSNDRLEGLKAFAEKRQPVYKGE